MIDWVPVFFIAFKALTLGTCMFLAIKWHYDQDKKKGVTRSVLRTGAIVITALALSAAALLWATLLLAQKLGLDLGSLS